MANIIIIIGIAILGYFLYKIFRQMSGTGDKRDEMMIFNQRLDGMNAQMQQALRETMKLVSDQLRESRDATDRSTRNITDQVSGFTTGITQLTENVKQMQDHVRGVASFQDVFRSPKLRGIWGESSLESSLEQYFSRDNYELQYQFKDGTIVDAILKLPNDFILPIDAKFNFENFEKIVSAESEAQKDQYRKLFFTDVKKKIDEIASKYILPAEKTTDFALMYIPAETIYYEIIANMRDMDIPNYARSKRIFIVSPNTFALSISAIRHWFKDVQLSKQTKEIMKKLDRIANDGRKLGDEFRKLGKHISDASSAYSATEKRVDLMVDRVEKVMELGEDTEIQERKIPIE